MIITYQGQESFKISQGDLTIAVNPVAKVSADVTLFTGLVGAEIAPRAISEKSGFVITGPGEYEIKDVFIKGLLIKESDLFKTNYLINYEGLKLCFLGSVEGVKDIEDVDILMVPVGSDPAVAYKLAVSLEPSIIIPMRHTKPTLEQFIKEGGEKVEAIDKYVVKKKDLEGKEGEIVVLKEE